jgi:hypothetical protein
MQKKEKEKKKASLNSDGSEGNNLLLRDHVPSIKRLQAHSVRAS